MLGSRAEALSRFQTANPYRVLVIGSGIMGASVAYACARRGWSTLVCDKGDLAGATSSSSTGLLHGGARYAKSMQFLMVGEGIYGREAFKSSAPHLVREFEYCVPAIEGGTTPYWLMKWGGRVYDLFRSWPFRFSSFPKSRALDAASFEQEGIPFGHPSLEGAVFFWDAQTNDHRLALTLLATAAQHATTVINYMKCTGFLYEQGKIAGVTLRDETSQEVFNVHAGAVINAAGPWVNELIKIDAPETPDHLRVDAGSHLVVRNFFGHTLGRGFFLEFNDGRFVFVLPHGNDLLIGTTSEGERPSKDELYPPLESRQYLLGGVNELFPFANLGESDIYAGFSAHRPLYNKRPGASGRAEAMSRRHKIRVSRSGLISILGGKITPALLIGEHTAEIVADLLGASYEKLPLGAPLFGGDINDLALFLEEETRRLALEFGIAHATSHHLLSTYGTKAEEVLALAQHYPLLYQPLDPYHPFLRAQVAYAVLNEMALNLTDVLSRRLRIERIKGNGLVRDFGPSAAERAADTMQELLGWTQEQKQAQIAAYQTHVHRGRGILR